MISACPNLAKNQYRKRFDKVVKKIQCLLCKKFHLVSRSKKKRRKKWKQRNKIKKGFQIRKAENEG